MFLGEYQHSLDAKGRVILPARFREELAGGGFLTSEIDGCLAIWTPDEFEVKAGEMKDRARGSVADRNVARAFFSGAVPADPDRQGRVAIPPHLRDFANLTRDVVLNGMYDHIEIWDAETWRSRRREGELGLAAGTS